MGCDSSSRAISVILEISMLKPPQCILDEEVRKSKEPNARKYGEYRCPNVILPWDVQDFEGSKLL